ncbi:MAG: glycosyltransferase family 61 protein [Propionibacteriaceae bacterium]|nr:glycosyltransferase family 61 protein [Propionibacteriaceae bacterium]
MTQTLPKLWAWPLFKQRFPAGKALMFGASDSEVNARSILELAPFGISLDDIIFLTDAVTVTDLVSPTIGFQYLRPGYAHPVIAETFDQLAQRAKGTAPVSGRIFVSRKLTKRSCVNAQGLEDLFRQYGFDVIYPEDFPFDVQISIFRNAEVVAGFCGSGMFNLVHSSRAKAVILLGSASYRATNEYFFAQLAHIPDIYYLLSPMPPKSGMRTDWRFDWDTLVAPLVTLLKEYGVK